MKTKTLIIVSFVMLGIISGCKENKSSSSHNGEVHAATNTLANPNWYKFGTDLPKEVPVLVESWVCPEDGRYDLRWKILCVNNMISDCNSCDVPTILYMAQLRMNRQVCLTAENWLAPDNYPQYHMGINITPWTIHYGYLEMNFYIDMLKGDRLEIWVMTRTDPGYDYSAGGAFFENLEFLRIFQVVKK